MTIKQRLCRIKVSSRGGFDVTLFDTHRQSIERETLPVGTTLEEAKAFAIRRATALPHVSTTLNRSVANVKSFNDPRGYGFVTLPDGRDFFVHYSALLMDGFKSLRAGEQVEFEIHEGRRGLQAINVIRLDSQDAENYRELLAQQRDLLALAVVDRRLRVVRVSADGRWHFVDSHERSHGLLHVCSVDSKAYSAAIKELEDLINSLSVKEQALHDFFERNPEFLLTDEYRRAHSKIVLEAEDADDLIPDFVLEPVAQHKLCDLLELKLPTARVDVLQERRERFAATIFEACAQLRTYRDYFEDERNRRHFREKYNLQAFRPRLFVLIGRRGTVDPLTWRRIEGDLPSLQVQTYDDLLDRVRHKLRQYGHLREIPR